MSSITVRESPLVAQARGIAREVASRYADDVDTKARFPAETFAALKQARLLSAAVPKDLGGGGADMRELAEVCTVIAQGCAASGMVRCRPSTERSEVSAPRREADGASGGVTSSRGTPVGFSVPQLTSASAPKASAARRR